jgi:rare lipoprotein A
MRIFRLLMLAAVFSVAACAGLRAPAPEPPTATSEQPVWRQTGTASWYGRSHHGRVTASGERFDMNGLTAAHRSLELGTVVRVTSLASGEIIKVRINDRGPYIRGRVIDLSTKAARRLGIHEAGLAKVRVEVFESDQAIEAATLD